MRYIRKLLIQYLVKHLLVALTEDDVLLITNKGWIHKNRRLTPEEVSQIREDAQSFKDSVLWNYMRNEVRYQANLRMFEQGTGENTLFGRAMLYNMQILEKFLSNVTKL